MAFTSAKYTTDEGNAIRAVRDNGQVVTIPADNGNRDFAELMAAVNAGGLAIDPPQPPDAYPDLTPRQFEWMLAYYELEDVWQAVASDAKANRAQAVNRNLYAGLRAQERAGGYTLADTLALLQSVRDRPQIANSGLDLSDDAIRGYWRHAAAQTFSSLTEIDPAPA